MNLKDFDAALAAFDWSSDLARSDARYYEGVERLRELCEIAAQQEGYHTLLLAAWATHKRQHGSLADLEVIRHRLGVAKDRRSKFLFLTIVAAVLVMATSVIIAILRNT